MKILSQEKQFLLNNPLFLGAKESTLTDLFSEPDASIRTFRKGETVFAYGQEIRAIGVLLSGTVCITKTSYAGGQLLVTKLDAGEMFGESFACSGGAKATVTVTAEKESKILFLNHIEKLPEFVQKNLMILLARKNLFLNRRISLLSLGTIRDKVLSFLQEECDQQQKNPFYLLMDRNEMAEYLCVDRSALSRELGKMKRENLLDYHKNCFRFTDKGILK